MTSENEQIKQNFCNKQQWFRLVYMLLFAIILYIVMMLVGLVVAVQVVFSLLTGKPNEGVADFAKDLTQYVYRIVTYLAYLDDRKPFPFESNDAENNASSEARSDDSITKQD